MFGFKTYEVELTRTGKNEYQIAGEGDTVHALIDLRCFEFFGKLLFRRYENLQILEE